MDGGFAIAQRISRNAATALRGAVAALREVFKLPKDYP